MNEADTRAEQLGPIDKNEGVVKREVFLGGARAPLEETPRVGLWEPRLWNITRCSVPVEPLVPPPIDTALLSAMMLFANIQPPSPVRKWKTVFSFSKRVSASFAPVRWMRSARSGSRPSLRRPWGTASCSRYERSPDTPCCCAASSRVVPPTCVPPPPWPLPWPCYDNGVDTFCAILHPGEPLSAPLPPATYAGNYCPVC